MCVLPQKSVEKILELMNIYQALCYMLAQLKIRMTPNPCPPEAHNMKGKDKK